MVCSFLLSVEVTLQKGEFICNEFTSIIFLVQIVGMTTNDHHDKHLYNIHTNWSSLEIRIYFYPENLKRNILVSRSDFVDVPYLAIADDIDILLTQHPQQIVTTFVALFL